MKKTSRIIITIGSIVLFLAAFHLPAGALMTEGEMPSEPVALKSKVPPPKTKPTNIINPLPPRPLDEESNNQPKNMTPEEAEAGIQFHDQ